ncbi:ATP-binding cassette domain-containing protein [Embleya sp. NBC_00888]|uniref:ATP-binding cassette domain-containing protein n=1 Tax=Embleya sp. NBC_00888 TaxID=2975960 RepID=UPI003866335B|nr:ATP-binding cassette domain-containing protein [Embleya sp. NBC_00888]
MIPTPGNAAPDREHPELGAGPGADLGPDTPDTARSCPAPGTGAVLRARNLTKRYGSVTALQDVTLDLLPGQVLALVGDNGAGKSTLLKILSGNTVPSDGTLLVDDEPRVFRGPVDATEAGIATVYQDLALALDLDVTGNLFLGREIVRSSFPGRHMGWLDRREMRRRTETALRRVHIHVPDINRECRDLSGGQRQAVAIARAVTWCERVLLLDEPTAALGVEQQREVLNLIDHVRTAGTSVVLVSHQLPHVMEIADRVAVLRRGRLVAVVDREAVTVERLVALITGLEGEPDHPSQPRPAFRDKSATTGDQR